MKGRTMAEKKYLNRELFSPDSIDRETTQFNKKLEALLAKLPPRHKMTPQEVRKERESGKSWMGPIIRLEDGEDRMVKRRREGKGR